MGGCLSDILPLQFRVAEHGGCEDDGCTARGCTTTENMTHLLDCEVIQREFWKPVLRVMIEIGLQYNIREPFGSQGRLWERGWRPESGMWGNGIIHLLGMEVSIRGSDTRSYIRQAAKHERRCLEDDQDGKQQSEGAWSQVEEMVQHATPMARDEEKDVSTPIPREHTDSI